MSKAQRLGSVLGTIYLVVSAVLQTGAILRILGEPPWFAAALLALGFFSMNLAVSLFAGRAIFELDTQEKLRNYWPPLEAEPAQMSRVEELRKRIPIPAGRVTLLGLVLLAGATPFLAMRSPECETLESFAGELPVALSDSDAVRSWIASQPAGLDKGQLISRILIDLQKTWRHRLDPGEDTIQPVSVSLRTREGDCEDRAAVIVAIARELGFHGRIALGEAGARGHAWAEILFETRPMGRLPPGTEPSFGGLAHLVTRNEETWLVCEPRASVAPFHVTHFIEVDGRLVPAEK
ncbi:MAG: hypothetical protein DIJKHBIC_00825 [Thermoanaerobaculia bacterium]|nr:hypothetical protein [Thermoanaerobaculia bacterium]